MKRSYFVIALSTISMLIGMACGGVDPALAFGDGGTDTGDGGTTCGCPGPQGVQGPAGPQGPIGPAVSKSKVYMVTSQNYVGNNNTQMTADITCNNVNDVLLSVGASIDYTSNSFGYWSCTPKDVQSTTNPAGATCSIYSQATQSNFKLWALCATP